MRVLGYVQSDSASTNFDAHNRHLMYCLRSRILDINNSIIIKRSFLYQRQIRVDLVVGDAVYLVQRP